MARTPGRDVVVLDIDGTLLDSTYHHALAWQRAFDRHGDALRSHWRSEYLAIRFETFPLPGATDLVHDLRSRGITVAVASSGDPQFAREALATLSIRQEVEVLTTAEDAEASKPAGDLIRKTLARVGDVRRAVVVGDTPYDVEAAAHCGLACVGLRSGSYAKVDLTDAGAASVVDGPAALVGHAWNELLREPRR